MRRSREDVGARAGRVASLVAVVRPRRSRGGTCASGQTVRADASARRLGTRAAIDPRVAAIEARASRQADAVASRATLTSRRRDGGGGDRARRSPRRDRGVRVEASRTRIGTASPSSLRAVPFTLVSRALRAAFRVRDASPRRPHPRPRRRLRRHRGDRRDGRGSHEAQSGCPVRVGDVLEPARRRQSADRLRQLLGGGSVGATARILSREPSRRQDTHNYMTPLCVPRTPHIVFADATVGILAKLFTRTADPDAATEVPGGAGSSG